MNLLIMKNLLIFLLLTFQSILLYAQDSNILSMSYNELSSHLESKNNNATVVNFWATWCRPCIAELPYFEQIQAEFKGDGVEVVLVSMDFELEKAAKYASRKGLISEVIFLDETNHNSWIPKIAPEWSGALPATLVLSPGKRNFHEGEIQKKELIQLIKTHIN